ncbi:MAG: DUF1150 family protein [Alphaproteobacteria bacterium]|nr:DUF1150 family protein [Alphaproteobacteria bacterium]
MIATPAPRATLTPAEFAAFGLEQVAYLRPVQTTDGISAIGVFSADGRQLATAPSTELAQALVRQNDLEPALVH